MIKVAIVDDDEKTAVHLQTLLNDFAKINKLAISAKIYMNGMDFLGDRQKYDIVLMDIMMPIFNGVEVSHMLRKFDESTQIIFITSMVQYAIDGYEVNAAGFLVKPVSYNDLATVLNKTLAQIEKNSSDNIVVKTYTSLIAIQVSSLLYVEVRAHELVYHTAKGEIKTKGTLKELEQRLQGKGFARCDSCYLINLKHVRSISDEAVKVANETIHMSRRRRKEFIDTFLKYSGNISYVR